MKKFILITLVTLVSLSAGSKNKKPPMIGDKAPLIH